MSVSRSGRLVKIAAVLAVAAAALWLLGLWRFAASMPQTVDDPARRTDAIVVLTGGSLRVESGLKLLAAGMAKKLFVSGVYRGVDVSALLHVSRQAPESVACCIVLGHAAADTLGNAKETAEWMSAEGFHSLRLVTANYHMPRSLLEFSRAMPDVEIVPNPVFPEFLSERPWWRSRRAATLIASEYSKYLFALVRPVLPAAIVPQGLSE
ncbi:MAG TPA: YdcF family protein [Stellaceae bacterium]|jgi:uncharacterized SAM-binding protein YcdF (DUF218 family)|nr:YdcF family protein [Stellaceae bacterium]